MDTRTAAILARLKQLAANQARDAHETAELQAELAGRLSINTAPPSLLTVKEAAERLRLHRDTVYRMTEDGTLSCTRQGRRVFVSEAAIETYLRQMTA